MKTKIKKNYNYVNDYVEQRVQPLQLVSIKLVVSLLRIRFMKAPFLVVVQVYMRMVWWHS